MIVYGPIVFGRADIFSSLVEQQWNYPAQHLIPRSLLEGIMSRALIRSIGNHLRTKAVFLPGTVRCYPRFMLEEGPAGRSQIDECVAKLKSKIPPMEHGALESRLEALLNDSGASADEVISILLQEFDPKRN